MGITYPKSFCRLRIYCPKGDKKRPPPVFSHSLGRKEIIKANFPKFVPEIDIADQKSWFWREGFNMPMVSVSLWQLLINREILSKASVRGLHDFLEYNGKILLATVMPDEFIDKLENNDYSLLIKNLRPDFAMIPDNYTYTDVPLYQSWSQTIRLINFANDFLKIDIPLIGLVKGANLLQIDLALRKQLEMGYISFAMPARELFEENLLDDFLPYVLRILKKHQRICKTDAELLLYGIGRRLKYKGIGYSNLSWFIEAKRVHYYKGGWPYKLVDPRIRFQECNCKACNGLMPQELFDLWIGNEETCLKILAIHNLLDLERSL